MGLFDGLKLAADLVKGGIAAFKASEKLEALVKRSRDECKNLVKPEQEQLYQEYANLDSAKSRETDTDSPGKAVVTWIRCRVRWTKCGTACA